MANKYSTIQEIFAAIATSIRGKLGTEDTIVADTFPTKIDSIITVEEGTSDGTAIASDIASGKIAYVQGNKITGTAVAGNKDWKSTTIQVKNEGDAYLQPNGSNMQLMIDAGANVLPVINDDTIFSMTNTYLASMIGLISTKIASGYTILSVSGTFSNDATSASTDILSGKTAYVKGSKVTGTITNNKSATVTKTSITKNTDTTTGGYIVQYVPDSTNTTEVVAIDKDTKFLITANTLNTLLSLTAAKIASGQTIGDISGTFTSDGTVSASNIETGYIAYSKGSKITGSLPVKTSISESATVTVDTTNKTVNFGTTTGTVKAIYSANSTVTVKSSYSSLADKIGLTAAKMVKGTTVLGITGTADVEAHDIAALISASY